MSMRTWFHGSKKWKTILDSGFNIDAPRVSDVGDFGWAIYLTKDQIRAKVHGKILAVSFEIDRMAKIFNPYCIDKNLKPSVPETPEEILFHTLAFSPEGDMLTIHGTPQEKEQISKQIGKEFLQRGFTGILSDKHREAAIFDLTIIKNIQIF